MILVDTSVWVEAFRRARSVEAVHLRTLLDQSDVAMARPVLVELLGGTAATEQRRLRRVLSALPHFTPTAATWDLLERWVEPAVRAGQRFGMADLLMAGVAAENNLEVWSLDGDFARMADLGFIRVHAARRA